MPIIANNYRDSAVRCKRSLQASKFGCRKRVTPGQKLRTPALSAAPACASPTQWLSLRLRPRGGDGQWPMDPSCRTRSLRIPQAPKGGCWQTCPPFALEGSTTFIILVRKTNLPSPEGDIVSLFQGCLHY